MHILDPKLARWAEDIYLVDYYACRDEGALEEELRRSSDAIDNEILRAALRQIDHWQKLGTLESERKKIQEKLKIWRGGPPAALAGKFRFVANTYRGGAPKASPKAPTKIKTATGRARTFDSSLEHISRVSKAWERLTDGLNSPDPEQAGRFQAFFLSIVDRNLSDPAILAALEVLETVKKRKGRSRNTLRSDDKVLIEMKRLVWSGMKIREAARQLAPHTTKRNTFLESTIKRLERGFREKMALRNSRAEK